jgi:hypothetical protein
MSDSKSIQDSMRKGWKSKRLIYRALEDNNADHTFVHEAIEGDPVVFPLFHSQAFRPQSESITATLCAMFRKRSLSVVICLPTDEASGGDSRDESENPETLQTRVEKDNSAMGKH